MRRSIFCTIAIAVIAMPVAATSADEPSDVVGTSSHSYYRPFVTNALFTDSMPQSHPAMLSEPGRLRVAPASYETSEHVVIGSTSTANLSNDLSFLDDPADEPQSEDEVDLTMLWQLVAVLGVVVLTCCVVVVKKSFRQQLSGDVGQLELVGTLPLSHRSVLQLVSVGETRVVVASDTTGVKSVTLLPPTFAGMVDIESDVEVTHA